MSCDSSPGRGARRRPCPSRRGQAAEHGAEGHRRLRACRGRGCAKCCRAARRGVRVLAVRGSVTSSNRGGHDRRQRAREGAGPVHEAASALPAGRRGRRFSTCACGDTSLVCAGDPRRPDLPRLLCGERGRALRCCSSGSDADPSCGWEFGDGCVTISKGTSRVVAHGCLVLRPRAQIGRPPAPQPPYSATQTTAFCFPG